MSAPTTSQVSLDGRFGSLFAGELPEMAVPWQAEAAPEPRLLALNEDVASQLGFDTAFLRSPEGLALLTGNAVPAGATPVAQAYSGHQFGSFNPGLGDGRALLLGEVTDVGGHLRDLHLKGSGRTPFARGGDGLAAVGPMLREYVISESMHALGIPTTRSLAVVATGRQVRRETMLPGAVLTRVASSHLRVGSFQYAAATGNGDLVQRLADHAISRHYSDDGVADADNKYLAFLGSVVSAQASLVAQWMLAGFVHGVMNTDNMTISGESIDFGPCAFMDVFDFSALYSSIDRDGRYAYANQPLIAEWNLARLAETVLPLIHEDQETAIPLAVAVLETFRPQYSAAWLGGMKAKLGLPDEVDGDAASALANDALTLLQENHVDYTAFFRGLSSVVRGDARPARDRVLDVAAFDAWAERWLALGPDADAMDRVNPVYIPRNHLVEEALAAATAGDLAPLNALLDVVLRPFDERPGLERYASGAPDDFGAYTTYCGT